MRLVINKWGNSKGIRLPKMLLSQMNVDVGSTVIAEFKDGKVILEPEKDEIIYDIHDLVREIPEDYVAKEVDWGKPEGKEIW